MSELPPDQRQQQEHVRSQPADLDATSPWPDRPRWQEPTQPPPWQPASLDPTAPWPDQPEAPAPAQPPRWQPPGLNPTSRWPGEPQLPSPTPPAPWQPPRPKQPPPWGQPEPRQPPPWPYPYPQALPRHRRHAVRNVVLAAGGLVLLAVIGAATAVRSVGHQRPARVVAGAASRPVAGTTAPGRGAGVVRIGPDEYASYDDGLQVAVTSARRASFSDPSRSSSPGVIVTIKISNGSGETLSLEVTNVVLRYGAEGVQADWVFDDSLHIFSGNLGAGQTATATYGFAVPRRERDVTVEVTPSSDHHSSTFTGQVS